VIGRTLLAVVVLASTPAAGQPAASAAEAFAWGVENACVKLLETSAPDLAAMRAAGIRFNAYPPAVPRDRVEMFAQPLGGAPMALPFAVDQGSVFAITGQRPMCRVVAWDAPGAHAALVAKLGAKGSGWTAEPHQNLAGVRSAPFMRPLAGRRDARLAVNITWHDGPVPGGTSGMTALATVAWVQPASR
jgi:hypothetical protein